MFIIITAAITIKISTIIKVIVALTLIYVFLILLPKISAKIDASKSTQTKPAKSGSIDSVRSPFEPHPDDPKADKTFFPELKEHEEKTKNNRNEESENGQEQ